MTRLLDDLSAGKEQAFDELLPVVHAELRRRAASYLRRERQNHTLQPTALVSETFLKLVEQRNVRWQNRAHFFAVASQAMRRILVDHARTRQRVKRGRNGPQVTLDEAMIAAESRSIDLLSLDDSRPQGPPGAVRLRATEIAGLRLDHAVIAREPVTFAFQPVKGASRYAVEIEDSQGRVVMRREVAATELTVAAGTLAPGAAYHWTVQTLDRAGGAARGASDFTTLSEEDGRQRDALRQSVASSGGGQEALLAEVDRRPGLYPEALRGFRAALAGQPTDPAIRRAVHWLDARAAATRR